MSNEDNEKVFFGSKEVSKKDKKLGVDTIFTKVNENYDLMNDLMSLGAHRLWKNHFVSTSDINENSTILDLAGGTGDISKIASKIISKQNVYLCDQNASMVESAKERSLNEGFYNSMHFHVASAEELPFNDNFFDQVFISFGFRNFSDKPKALKEIRRVMKSGGFLNILEFSKVQDQIFSKIYDFYSFNVIPKIGKLISNDSDSYEYLVESIRTHEDQESLRKMILDCGFDKANFENLFNGIVSIHKAQK